jgi:hypothetical protein
MRVIRCPAGEFEMRAMHYLYDETPYASARVLLKDGVRNEPLTFDVTDDIKSPLDNANTFLNKESLPDDARDFLMEINTIIASRDYEKLLSRRAERFLATFYGDDFINTIPGDEPYWEDYIAKMPLIDIEALKYVIGESAILIYHESDTEPSDIAVRKLTPVVMAKFNNTWMLW